jgi:hypothetical protein
MSDEKTIATGAELNRRIRESGQDLEYSKENGWRLNQTHERVSDRAVSERRAGWERMAAELSIDKMVSTGRQLLQVDRSQRIQQNQQHTEGRPSENVVKLTPRR